MLASDSAYPYEKIRDLGEGAAGKTFLVRSIQMPEHLFALKIFSNLEKAPELLQSFEQEWRVLEQLSHPHLAKVFHHGRESGGFYFTTEYVEGKDIVSACEGLDWNAIFLLIVQAAWALDYLHEKGFIHRDLKPANLLVGKIYEGGRSEGEERLRLKLIDFGLACRKSPLGFPCEIVGTLPYIAPEILSKSPYDHRADLYSLGVVLYQIAIGRLPLEIRGQFADYLKRLSQEQVDFSALQEWGVPRGVVRIIEALLQLKPELRLSHAGEIIRLLNEEEDERFPMKAPQGLPLATQKLEQPRPEFEVDLDLSPAAWVEKIRLVSRQGKKEESEAYAKHLMPLVPAWEDAKAASDFYASAVHLCIDRGEFAEARKRLDAMRSHPRLAGQPSFEAELTALNLTYRKGDLQEAANLAQAIRLHDNQEVEPSQLARFHNICALLAKEGKDWQGARAHFEQAAQAAKGAQRPDQELALRMNAAAICLDQGSWKEAYRLYRQCREIALSLGNRILLANISNNLGNLLLVFGRWTEANEALSESLEISEEQGLKPLIASNLNLLAQAEAGKGNWEKADEMLRRSLSFSQALGDAQPILQAQLGKAYLEFQQGRRLDCLMSARLLHQKAENFRQSFYLNQADWLSARCEIEGEKVDEARVSHALARMKVQAIEQNALGDLWQVWADEAALHRRMGRREEAVAAYESALRLLSEVRERIPEEYRESYFRDRKKEKLERALLALKGEGEGPAAAGSLLCFEFSSKKQMKGEFSMAISDQKDSREQKGDGGGALSFEKWVEINRRLLTQSQVGQILDEIMDNAISLTDAERGFVIYSDSQELDVKSSRNMEKESLKGEEEKFSCTIAQEVMRRGESIMIFDAQRDGRFSGAASVLSLKIRSVLCVPLRLGLKTVGLVYLDNRFREGVFRQEHLPIIEALADQTSLALEHARLHQENLDKIEELKKSKELIEKLNQRLERDLDETSANLLAAKESLKRQNEEISLRYTYDKIIGNSPKLKQVLKKLDRIVDSSMSVFIHGESGTGKELIAQAIHFNGPRKEKPFVAENCTALPETLLESELFGYVQGAFTGADKNKIGLFELANGGTLFLDEVGDMPLSMQAKLLRVLQEGEVRQVGGKNYRKVDVRIITASNKDLKELVDEGKFRQDLYYRINVVQLDLPPLRERREDIPLLIRHFIDSEAAKLGAAPPKLTKEALKLLVNYEWPGNIRELVNEVTRFISLRDSVIDVSSLSPHLVEKVEESEQHVGQKGLDFLISLVEKRAITDAMQRARGNKVKAARLLKIGRRTLYAKLDLYQIDPELGKNAIFMSKKSSPKLAS